MPKKNLLDFFLQTQEKITQIKEKKTPLLEIRRQAQKKSDNNFNHSLKTALKKDATAYIYEDIQDEEYKKIFTKTKAPKSSDSASLAFIFPSLTSTKNCLESKNRDESSFFIKHGFFTQEYEIFEAKKEGFDAITLYVKTLDHYKIQYLTEIGRDYKTSIIFTISDKDDLEKVMKTDCPYLLIFGLNKKTFTQNTHEIFDLMTQIPSNFLTGIYNPSLKAPMGEELEKLGVKYFVIHKS